MPGPTRRCCSFTRTRLLRVRSCPAAHSSRPLQTPSIFRCVRPCSWTPDGGAEPTHDEAAELVVGLHDIAFRDRVISRLALGDETLDRLITEVAHLAQPPYDAPVVSVLAMAAYFRGEGVVAMAAAERALDTDCSYSLAQLVVDCLERQVEPKDIREVWLGDVP